MKRSEEVKVEFTIQWVEKAEIDLNTAEYLCRSGVRYVSAAAFHAQQAAEKYLKASWSGIKLSSRKYMI